MAISDTSVENEELAADVDRSVAELLKMPLAFQEQRHWEKIASGKTVSSTWRMKERVSN